MPEPSATPSELLPALLDGAALGALLARFVHDANNRQTVLQGSLDLLADASTPEEVRQRVAVLAAQAIRQLGSELRTLSEAARTATPPVVATDVGVAVRRAREALVELGVALDWHVHVEPGLAVAAEPGRLEIALLRLGRIAARAGASSFSVRGERLDPDVKDPAAAWPRRGHWCCLRCTWDNAAGTVPAQEFATMAEPGGLEVAAVVAFAASLRGRARPTPDGTGNPAVELVLPAAS